MAETGPGPWTTSELRSAQRCAYPAEYGNSGVMTFIINQDGVLLQKDLGKTTTETATSMTEFDPDNTWSLVEE
jgi:hypothetical protein